MQSKQKETHTLQSGKNKPLGHFLNILPFSSVMKMKTERNLKTFQIEKLATKTAFKQVNLHVKHA